MNNFIYSPDQNFFTIKSEGLVYRAVVVEIETCIGCAFNVKIDCAQSTHGCNHPKETIYTKNGPHILCTPFLRIDNKSIIWILKE